MNLTKRILNDPAGLYKYFVVSIIIFIPQGVKLLFFPTYPGSDDAFIHLAVVKTLLKNAGWGINLHAPVNISSSPVFTILIYLFNYIFPDTLHAAQVLSSISTTVGLFIAWRLTKIITEEFMVQIFVLTFLATNMYLWYWNGAAIETTFSFAILIGVIYVSFLKISSLQRFLWGMLTGIACLTRYEFLLLLPSIFLASFFWGNKVLLKRLQYFILGLIITVAPWIFYSFVSFHSVVPTTFYAKGSTFNPYNMDVILFIAKSIVSAAPFYGLLSIIIIYHLITKEHSFLSIQYDEQIKTIVYFIFFTLLYYLLFTAVAFNSTRYYLPVMMLLPFFFPYVIDTLPGYFFASKRTIIILSCFFHIAWTLLLTYFYTAPTLQNYSHNYWRSMKNTSLFLSSYVPPNSTVLIQSDFGMVSYYTEHRFTIFDGGLLASPELKELSLSQRIDKTQAQYVVQSLGHLPFEFEKIDPRLKGIHTERFVGLGLRRQTDTFYTNIYKCIDIQ